MWRNGQLLNNFVFYKGLFKPLHLLKGSLGKEDWDGNAFRSKKFISEL